MEFDSFEHAMGVCMTAEEGSAEQVEAMLFCLENAPPELLEIIQKRLQERHGHQCGCGSEK